MSVTIAAPNLAEGRTFAQLPLSKPFRDLCNQVSDLHGAFPTRFSAKDSFRENPFVTFIYHGYQFRAEETLGKIHLSVADAHCPERIVFDVLQHFSWRLSPGLRE